MPRPTLRQYTARSNRFFPFLADLLRERNLFVDAGGSPQIKELCDHVEKMWQGEAHSYESLRKSIKGERPLNATQLEEIARAVGVSPWTFNEYRIIKAQESFDPAFTGSIETAYENADRWAELAYGSKYGPDADRSKSHKPRRGSTLGYPAL
jgi:hypothetical protein